MNTRTQGTKGLYSENESGQDVPQTTRRFNSGGVQLIRKERVAKMGSRGKSKRLCRVELPGWNRDFMKAQNIIDQYEPDLNHDAKVLANHVYDANKLRRTIREAEQTAGDGNPQAGTAFPGPLAAGSGSFSAMRDMEDAAFRRGVEARKETARLIEQSKALKGRIEEAWEEGRQAGFKQAAWPIIKCCMAGACLMLQETFGMDEDQIVDGLTVLHEKITWALTYSELAEDVLNKTGIELRIDDPLEPIRRK